MAHNDDKGSKSQSEAEGTLGRIALKRVRVTKAEARSMASPQQEAPVENARNRLVPYLDLFCRLNDDEISRLALVSKQVVVGLRKQVNDINRVLQRYQDLLPRLSDDELVRLTGGNVKTIHFWRLCQPRVATHSPESSAPGSALSHDAAAQIDSPQERVQTVVAPEAAEDPRGEKTTGREQPIGGEPFPGFETTGIPAAAQASEPMMGELEISMFDEGEEEENDPRGVKVQDPETEAKESAEDEQVLDLLFPDDDDPDFF